jgi:hypothetical protein
VEIRHEKAPAAIAEAFYFFYNAVLENSAVGVSLDV